ncbi:MAG: hypothetical protein H6667_23915 [Ardenticatenaceae bacterium]|nr:hypothetical protein [Ardenticatenaceae bacterium]
MRIYFERSGGMMGKPVTATVDTKSLPSDEATAWREMVLESSFFALPETLKAASSESRDQFQYKVVVEVEEVSHTVETTDGAAPDSLRPLLRRLTIATRNPSTAAFPQ